MSDPYNVCFLTGALDETSATEVVQTSQQVGFRVTTEVDSLDAYVGDRLCDGNGSISLEYDDVLTVDLFFNLGEQWNWNDPRLLVSFPSRAVDPRVDREGYSRERCLKRASALAELVGTLATVVNPEYVWTMLVRGPEPDAGLRPERRPISENITQLSWLTVFSPSLVEELGGRDRVLKTPAYRVEELDSGHVLVVRTDNPVDPSEGPAVSPEAYLLKGKSLDELQSDQPRIDDPFRHLEPGDLGVDVVIAQENVDGDPTNDDLELVRVEVDDDYRLWDVESEEFVRRVFDEDGDSYGGETTVPSEEHHPPLVHSGYPVEFVAIDSPDGETLITKVMGLDVEIDKLRLLVSMASMVEDADDRREALQTLHSTIDEAKRAADVDGIERLLHRLL